MIKAQKKRIIILKMKNYFTLIYWKDHSWYVGKLKEVPGVFSQGKTLKELKENILDAYHLVIDEEKSKLVRVIRAKTREVRVSV